MARPTDTKRGALIVLSLAVNMAQQPDLFADGLSPEFWYAIAHAAGDQLEECYALDTARRSNAC